MSRFFAASASTETPDGACPVGDHFQGLADQQVLQPCIIASQKPWWLV